MSLREARRLLNGLREPPAAKYARWRRRSPLVRLLQLPTHVPLARLPGLLWRLAKRIATPPAGDGWGETAEAETTEEPNTAARGGRGSCGQV